MPVSPRISVGASGISVSAVFPVGVVSPMGGIPVVSCVVLFLEMNSSPFPVSATLVLWFLPPDFRLGPGRGGCSHALPVFLQ
jgi:hypothetical protein